MAHNLEAPSPLASLNPALLHLSDLDKAFLHDTISSDDAELKERILKIQKTVYAKYPYPCILKFHFVVLMMALNTAYPQVVERGKLGGSLFLDLGCCMGTDLRKLVKDGYPASNVFGCDLRQSFIDCGFEFYGDKDKCGITFFTDDIFELPYPPTPLPPSAMKSDAVTLSSLTGKLTHIYTGALFHLFDEPTQYALALRLATLLKREPGAVIFGRHQGLVDEGYIEDHITQNRYGHSMASWPVLWHRVLSEIESTAYADEHLRVNAVLQDGFRRGDFTGLDNANLETPKMLYWSVHIL